ncbi:MAG: hypothetical protein ACO3LF_01015 [Candidatus Kariarchaeum pelagius]
MDDEYFEKDNSQSDQNVIRFSRINLFFLMLGFLPIILLLSNNLLPTLFILLISYAIGSTIYNYFNINSLNDLFLRKRNLNNDYYSQDLICHTCGSKNKISGKYCEHCGSSIISNPANSYEMFR